MTPTTKFRMASHSKLFTAIAIMQLREAGQAASRRSGRELPPWFKAKPAGDDDGPITIEQLLSHSSGLQREAGDHWTSFEFPTADELRRLYADRQAAFAPSVRWKYSNLAYAVAGMVVEQVSGERWADYVERNIFKPLGMTRVQRRQERAGARRAVRAPHARRNARDASLRRRARHGGGHRRHVERRGHGEVRLGAVPQGSARRRADREHRFAARDAPRALGGRELDVGDWPRLRHQPHQGQDVRRPRRRLSRQHDADAHSTRRQGGRHRAHEHERLQPVRHRAAVDGDGRDKPSRKRRRRSRRLWRGIRRGRASPDSTADAAETRRSCCSTRGS